MNQKRPDKTIRRVKTGFLERRIEMARAGVVSGSKMLAYSAGNLFASEEQRAQRQKAILSDQANYLVKEISKLKGSVVKIGQMMALYGEYFLPPEVNDALHTLEDETVAMAWPGIRKALAKELGEARMAELQIDPVPLAAASMGQVHRARRKSDNAKLCIKVQYPGVADSIDGDFNAIIRLLNMAKLVPASAEINKWMKEIRTALYMEVDYLHEAEKTESVRQRLANDPRYIVPRVYREYTTKAVLTTSYEPGFAVTHKEVQSISIARRSKLGEAMLSVLLKEIFEWGDIQTDPNYGNYRIRLDPRGRDDKLVLLDFGAMHSFPAEFLDPVCGMIVSAHKRDPEAFLEHAYRLEFMKPSYPKTVLENFAELGLTLVEPLSKDHSHTPDFALNEHGEYCWRRSKLPKRAAYLAGKASLSTYFTMPPTEFMFINRKLVGVYTFIRTLNAEFNGYKSLRPHLD